MLAAIKNASLKRGKRGGGDEGGGIKEGFPPDHASRGRLGGSRFSRRYTNTQPRPRGHACAAIDFGDSLPVLSRPFARSLVALMICLLSDVSEPVGLFAVAACR